MLRLSHGGNLRIASTDDIGPIPLRIGRAGICVEAKPPADALPEPDLGDEPWSSREHRPLSARNPILEWLTAKSTSMRDYLQHLARMDASLADSLKDTYSLRHVRRRLALTLFIDFAHDQGLSAGEVATLIGDAQRAASDAVNFLIGAAVAEAGATIET